MGRREGERATGIEGEWTGKGVEGGKEGRKGGGKGDQESGVGLGLRRDKPVTLM